MQAVFSQLIRIKRTIKLESFQSKTRWLGYRERIRFVFKNGCQERHSFVTWGYFETKSFSRWVINQYKDNGLFHRHWINLWVDSKHSIFSAKIKILRLLKSLTSIKIWYSGLPRLEQGHLDSSYRLIFPPNLNQSLKQEFVEKIRCLVNSY